MLRHHARDLRNVCEVVRDPRREELSKRDGAELRMLAREVELIFAQTPRREGSTPPFILDRMPRPLSSGEKALERAARSRLDRFRSLLRAQSKRKRLRVELSLTCWGG